MSDKEDGCCPDECGLPTLPDETLIIIFRYLHYKDLVRISRSCCRFQRLASDDVLWKWQCVHYFVEYRRAACTSWRERFVSLHRDFGKYPDYKLIKQTWNKLENYLHIRSPLILISLNGPVSEEALDAFEQRTGEKLPLDLRASYRIHDGQKQARLGLMGGAMQMSHVRSDELLPFETVARTYMTGGHTEGCVILTKDLFGQSLQLLALSGRGGYFPAPCFKDFLVDYAEKLTQDKYHILKEGLIIKFYHEPSCIATTSGITVKPTTCFIPELSTIGHPQTQYFFSYRIVMEMSEDAPAELSCKLETRNWIIKDGHGNVTSVNGPGVVGEYPEMRPGAQFSWISCCTFDTPSGSMEGYFTFKNLRDDSRMEIKCPCYHMQALPSLTAAQRREIVRMQRNQT